MLGVLLVGLFVGALTRTPAALSGFAECSQAQRDEQQNLVPRRAMLEEDRQELADALEGSRQDKEFARRMRDQVEWDILVLDYTRRDIALYSQLKWEYLRSAFFLNLPPQRQTPHLRGLPPRPFPLF